MSRLTPEATEVAREIAGRYGVSPDAVETLLVAVARGNGMQAQFNHLELGGMGQWSQGGMTMVGDMFNNGLKATVNALCSELSQVVAGGAVFTPVQQSGGEQSQFHGASIFVAGSNPSPWPAGLGFPSSTGAQNNMRYGVFPDKRRLALEIAGRMEVFDTGDHLISGVSQQQSGDQSLTFTSQFGLVRVADLRKVTDAPQDIPAERGSALAVPEQHEDIQHPIPDAHEQPAGFAGGGSPDPSADAIISLIRKLADLKDAGILTEAEFETKKSELLSRL